MKGDVMEVMADTWEINENGKQMEYEVGQWLIRVEFLLNKIFFK